MHNKHSHGWIELFIIILLMWACISFGVSWQHHQRLDCLERGKVWNESHLRCVPMNRK